MLAALLALALPAHANGQTTHVWITRHAIEHLDDGPLKELVSDPANEAALVHGAMFPDGGYPLGHAYAEDAHWEGFQGDYQAWIRDHHAAPFSDEGARHVAFLLGLGSHGMADQTFDAFYFNWSSIKDAEHGWAQGESFDEASDFIFASIEGGQSVPERWVPQDTLIDIYTARGIDVDADTLDDGQGLLETAIALVGLGSQNPDLVDEYAALFPWGGAHLVDPELPGTPACEGAWVARYWEEVYARLVDAERPRRVLGTWPEDGSFGHARDHTAPEARVSLLFPVGLASGDPDPALFEVVDEAGTALPFDVWVYYGAGSHVVHLVPTEDWPEDRDITVRARASLPFHNGEQLDQDVVFGFSTRPPPVENAGLGDTGGPKAESGCSHAPAAPALTAVALALLSLGRRRRRAGPRPGPPTRRGPPTPPARATPPRG